MTPIAQILAAVAALAFARGAASSSPATPVRLDYRAPDSCGDRAAFIGEIRSRTQRMREAIDHEPARAVEVTISEVPGKVSGRLRVHDGTGVSERRLDGTSCESVISGLAFILALAIDPEASTTPRPASTRPERSPSPAPAPQPSRRSRLTPATRAWSVGAQGSLRSAVAPKALVALGAYVKVDVRSGIFADASAKLSVQRGQQTAHLEQGGAKFSWLDAHADACLWKLALSRAARLAPCAGIDAGVLRVSGVDAPNAESVTRPWLSLGGLLRLELRPTAWFAVEPEAGLGFPVVRDSFFLKPSSTVHEVPVADVHGGLSLGLVLP